jgi:hypothetical protein
MTMKPTREEIRRTIEELIELGLIRDSGRRRNGQIIYERTPFAKSAKDDEEIPIH